MQLTAAQTRRIAHITNLITKYYQDRHTEGRFTFEVVEVTPNGDAYVFCSNSTDLRWFDTHHWAGFFISKKGGIPYYSGNMLPKLVLPATPRRCKYEDPYKKSK